MLGQSILEPVRAPLQLLGGSSTGKPSKLAALAAARKRKATEEASGENTGAVSLLDQLVTRSGQAKDVPSQPPPSRTYPIRKRKSPSPVPEPEPAAKLEDLPETVVAPQPNLSTTPSIFAETMCGTSSRQSKNNSPAFSDSMRTILYGHNSYNGTNPFAGPSPDDIVTQAQSKGSKKSNNIKSTTGATNGVANLSLEENVPASTPKIKSKGLDVLAEYEKSARKAEASFVVIGHIDHGKSTLMGRLLYDLKVVDQRSVDKIRKEAENMGKSSFALAWLMDSRPDEREHGVTIDIATQHFETEKTKFTILDAPGHKDFVSNMIAGANQSDFAILVIDAGNNSFDAGLKGQTKEHAILVRSMGGPGARLIVAVNKMDTVDWSEDRFIEIKEQLSSFLVSAGYQAKNLTFVPCAGLTGQNIVNGLPQAAKWYNDTSKYTSQTLVQALESYPRFRTHLKSPFRLSISDVFRGSVTNPLSISGMISAGTIQVGETILALPANETAVIKGIEINNAESVDWAVSGQIATLHLTDIDPVHLKNGDVVCDPRHPVPLSTAFEAKVLVYGALFPMPIDVHRGGLHVPARISNPLIAVLDSGSGDVTKKKPKVVQAGMTARLRVGFDEARPLEPPNRIILRSGGVTTAAGIIEKVFT